MIGINLQDLQKELLELAEDGRSDVEMRAAIVGSQWGHLLSHMTHDQILNPTARPYGSPAGEVNDAGHFLLQSMTYVALRGIDIESALEVALAAIRDRDFQKQELKGLVNGVMAYPGPCTGVAYVDPDCSRLHQMPNNMSAILVTNHPISGLAQHAHKLMGIITNQGGMSCHAAIIAREFRIPCVVGKIGATSTIPHGAFVSISSDGDVEVKEK